MTQELIAQLEVLRVYKKEGLCTKTAYNLYKDNIGEFSIDWRMYNEAHRVLSSNKRLVYYELNEEKGWKISELGIKLLGELESKLLDYDSISNLEKSKLTNDAGIASFNNLRWVKGLRVASLIIGIIGGILGGIAFFNNKNGIPTDNMVTKEFLKEYTEKFQNEALNHTNSDTLNTHP